MTTPSMPVVAGTTRLAAVIGWPISHSASPAIMNAAFAAAGVDAVHVALAVAPDDLGTVVGALRAVGALGANVTVPHKVAVMGLCDRLTDEARLVGAVNLLRLEDGALVGDNCDAAGLAAALAADVGALEGERALVVGTGGASRAAVVALSRSGAVVSVAGRRPDAALELVALASAPGRAIDLADEVALAGETERARIVVNATTLGMRDEPLPAACHALGPEQVAYDLVYRTVPPPFLVDAAAAGAGAFDGTGMLVNQAAIAFERWTGLEAPVAVMRAALAP
jgi:shikimate dehydrogenase